VSKAKKIRRKMWFEAAAFNRVIRTHGPRLLGETPDGTSAREFVTKLWPLVLAEPGYEEKMGELAVSEEEKQSYRETPFAVEASELEYAFKHEAGLTPERFPWTVLREQVVTRLVGQPVATQNPGEIAQLRGETAELTKQVAELKTQNAQLVEMTSRVLTAVGRLATVIGEFGGDITETKDTVRQILVAAGRIKRR